MSSSDPTEKVNRQIEELQEQLKDNIKMEQSRGANLEGLSQRTEELKDDTNLFEKKSESVKWKMFWRLFQWMIVAGILILLLVSIVFGIFRK